MENRPLNSGLGENVRRARKVSGLSLADLAGRVTAAGASLSLNVLSRVELGNRGLDLDELVALAHALHVPPIELVFPLGKSELVEVLPGVEVSTWAAAKWFSGEDCYPGPDDFYDRFEEWKKSTTEAYRWDDRLRAHWGDEERRMSTTRFLASQADTESERMLHERESELAEARMMKAATRARQHRANMRAAGLTLDPLHGPMSVIDEMGV